MQELNKAIEQEEDKRKAAAKQVEVEGAKPTQSGDPEPAKTDAKPLVKSKPIQDVSVSQVFDSVLSGAYIETAEQANAFIEELKAKLETAVKDGARVRIR